MEPSIKEALELKPCPFCGGEAWMLNGGPGNWFVQCTQCKCTTNDVQRGHAAELWNTRATLSPPAGASTEAQKWLERAKQTQCCDPIIDSLFSSAIDLLASGLVQDEAAIRKDEREKCLSRVCEALLVMSDGWKGYPSEGDSSWVALSNAATLLCGKERVTAIRSARDGGAES